MSSIKPPSGKPSGLPPATDASSAKSGAAKAPSDAFRKVLDEPDAAAAAGPSLGAARAAAPRTDAVAIAQELRAGRIDAETAVNKLVEKALAKADAVGLPPAKRSDLEALLRDALASDPTLSQLSKDLERGR